MHESINDRLCEYLDGEVTPQDRAAIEQHLAGCEMCRADLDVLRVVRARASTLADAGPEGNLWPGVAARIHGGATTRPPLIARRFSFTLPQLVAASLALMILSGGMVWLARLGGPTTDFPTVGAANEQHAVEDPASTAYELEVADLHRAIWQGRSRLDEETIRALDEDLEALDRAIRQCREIPAVRAAAERQCISAARSKKLDLLRRAAAKIHAAPAPSSSALPPQQRQ